MALSQNKCIIIVCEGSSEFAYIQEVNRLMREMELNAVFRPISVGTGFYTAVQTKYREVKRANPRADIYIWVDADIYLRNERDCNTAYNHRPAGVPAFLFSQKNFEDFLATHLPLEKLQLWLEVCRQNGHLTMPLVAEVYTPLFKANLFAKYEKGTLPFNLTEEMLMQMLDNQNDKTMPLHCDFADLIRRSVSISRRRNCNGE